MVWNPSNCGCECDKSCDVGEYLDHENCKCRKKLVEECTEKIDEVKMAKITLAEHGNIRTCSCTIYIVLFTIIFTINIRIGTLEYINHDKKQLLEKVLFFKQQFTEHIKMTVKSISTKNQTYYFFNNMINIKNFDSNLLKIDKKAYKNIDIYYTGYITIKKLSENGTVKLMEN